MPVVAWAVPDTIAQRVQACTPCHGRQGVATPQAFFPRISGKPAGYLFNQLLNFREGRRTYRPMNALIDDMSDAYLMEIATYFSSLELPYPPPAPVAEGAQDIARGRRLVQGGLGDAVPACVRCHGGALTGVAPAVPGLVGLSRYYIVEQLGAWRTHARQSLPPDCMGLVSQRLSLQDIDAVASYLSQLAIPADAQPAATAPPELPFRCGGVK